MKYAIVILMILPVITQAEEFEKNLLRGIDKFAQGVDSFVIPSGKPSLHIYIQRLVDRTTESISSVLISSIIDYYEQASRVKKVMIKDIEVAYTKFTEHLDNDEKMEKNLIIINKLIEKLLNCTPEYTPIKSKDLSQLPKFDGKVLARRGNEKWSNLFVDFAGLYDSNIRNIYNILNNMFLAGWQNVRLTYGELQQIFADDHLNPIFHAFGNELTKIDNDEENIKSHVKNDTWEHYKELKSRVNAVLGLLKQSTQS